MLKEHHLAADSDGVVVAGAAPDELAEERILHDVGGDEVAAARLPDVDGVEVVGIGDGDDFVVIGGGVGGGDGAAAELEGLHFLEDGFDFGELATLGHGGGNFGCGGLGLRRNWKGLLNNCDFF